LLTARPRGTSDILPGQVEKWQQVERIMRQVCREYGYREMRTPIFEHTELFVRGVGETTDIVEKEMYTFLDRGNRSLTLRPEGTASAVRAYLENKMQAWPQPVKLYYLGPMFRYDRPQAGRYRQFHQFGAEVFGSHHPALDTEVMAMAMDIYRRLGLDHVELQINSVGCPGCRPALREKLQEFLRPRLPELCGNCRDRFERNPLRILDCKSESCAALVVGAPTTGDCLCDDCREHFEAVQKYLQTVGLPHKINLSLVRGLDYYTHTAFEIVAPEIGAQSSVGGGGRYNGLVEACGGPPAPGIGFALGLERILLAMEARGVAVSEMPGPDVFVAVIGPEAEQEAFSLVAALRRTGLQADRDYLGRSLKAQMRYAGKINARYTVLLGGEEYRRGVAVLRHMAGGSQEEVPLAELIQRINK
jgi:histidyl-tRNA synthetase